MGRYAAVGVLVHKALPCLEGTNFVARGYTGHQDTDGGVGNPKSWQDRGSIA